MHYYLKKQFGQQKERVWVRHRTHIWTVQAEHDIIILNYLYLLDTIWRQQTHSHWHTETANKWHVPSVSHLRQMPKGRETELFIQQTKLLRNIATLLISQRCECPHGLGNDWILWQSAPNTEPMPITLILLSNIIKVQTVKFEWFFLQ